MKAKVREVKDRATPRESRMAAKIHELERRLADGNEKLESAQKNSEDLLGRMLKCKQRLAQEQLYRARDNHRREQRIDALTWALQLAQMAAREAQEGLWDEQAKTSGALKIESGEKLAVVS